MAPPPFRLDIRYGVDQHTLWRFGDDIIGPHALYAWHRAGLVTWHVTPEHLIGKTPMRPNHFDQPIAKGGQVGIRYDFGTPLEWREGAEAMQEEIHRMRLVRIMTRTESADDDQEIV